MSNVPLIGGQHGVVFFGPRDNPRCLRYWAERGMIHCEDSRDNSYETLTIREFLQRVRGINDMIGKSKASLAAEGFAHADELQRQQSFVEEAADLAKKAQEQGLPPNFSGGLEHHVFWANIVAPGQGVF